MALIIYKSFPLVSYISFFFNPTKSKTRDNNSSSLCTRSLSVIFSRIILLSSQSTMTFTRHLLYAIAALSAVPGIMGTPIAGDAFELSNAQQWDNVVSTAPSWDSGETSLSDSLWSSTKCTATATASYWETVTNTATVTGWETVTDTVTATEWDTITAWSTTTDWNTVTSTETATVTSCWGGW